MVHLAAVASIVVFFTRHDIHEFKSTESYMINKALYIKGEGRWIIVAMINPQSDCAKWF